MTDGNTWLKIHCMKRWLAKMESDGPQPGIVRADIAAAQHRARVSSFSARIAMLAARETSHDL